MTLRCLVKKRRSGSRPKNKEFGTYLGVLSQAANVVDEDVSDDPIVRLSEAA